MRLVGFLDTSRQAPQQRASREEKGEGRGGAAARCVFRARSGGRGGRVGIPQLVLEAGVVPPGFDGGSVGGWIPGDSSFWHDAEEKKPARMGGL